MRFVTFAAAAVALTVSPPARAYDFAVNAGAVEVVTLPERQHAGFYPYLGVSLIFPFSKLALIPSLTVEAAPDIGHWGFVWSLVADFPVHARLGIDADVTLLHDQTGSDVRHAELFLGAGVGFSIFLGRWTISPYCNIFRDLSADGWAIVPGFNLAATR
ncbi:MAG TPA: hypothetical protein VGH63_16230 [Polyangia bacterium]